MYALLFTVHSAGKVKVLYKQCNQLLYYTAEQFLLLAIAVGHSVVLLVSRRALAPRCALVSSVITTYGHVRPAAVAVIVA